LGERFNKTRSENELKNYWYKKNREDISAIKKFSKLSKPLFDDETYHQRHNFPTILLLEPKLNLVPPKLNEPFRMNPN
jgi:hypothetical protein